MDAHGYDEREVDHSLAKRSESTWSLVDFHVKVEAITTAWSPTAYRSRVRAQ